MNNTALTEQARTALFEFLLRLGDDALLVSHRLSEWCGHGPVLEEDIALTNIALDCIGQASMILRYAGEIEGKGRDEDALAYWRDALEFRNSRITELPKGDFAFTICRQFFFSSYAYLMYKALLSSPFETLQGIASKGIKETEYHVRHTREWMLRLGDGTEESSRRLQNAIDELWDYTHELFMPDASVSYLLARGDIPDRSAMKQEWLAMTSSVLTDAKMKQPAENKWTATHGARDLRHTEHLGHLLSEMQIVARSNPGAAW